MSTGNFRLESFAARHRRSPLAKVLLEWAAPSEGGPSIVHDPYSSLYCTSCPDHGWCPECGGYEPPPVSLETLELIAGASKPRNLAVGVLRSRKPLES